MFRLTCAKRHQMRQSWEFMSEFIFDNNEVQHISKSFPLSHLPPCLRNVAIDSLNIAYEENETYATVAAHSFYGSVVKVNCAYVLDIVEEEQIPVFFIIRHIISIRNNWLLCDRYSFRKYFLGIIMHS